jgi:flagellar hook-associated protein 1 FlgK
MSDLLTLGLSGVTAYRNALAAVGDNVANAETPGYARREVVLREGSGAGGSSPLYRESMNFGGVEAASVGRAWDAYRAADSRYAASAAGRADVRQQWLSSVETTLDDGPAGVGTLMGGFFNAGESLAATPSDKLGRTAMLTALDSAAQAIGTTADGLARVSDGIAKAVQIDVDGLNGDLASLVEVNKALKQVAPGLTSRASMEDERDRLLDSIATRIDVNASIGGDGVATLTLGGATAVTLLDKASRAVVSTATAADGRIQLRMFANGTTTPLPATGGRLAGLVDVAASTADKRTAFEAMAQKLVTDVNNWSAQGVNANGNPGGPLLSMTAGAVSLKVVTTDPNAIAAASTGGIENGNLLALASLRGTSGAEAGWAALVAANAQALSSAKSEAAATATRRDGSLATRDEISGIDLDKEAAELLRYQRAYDGSAKIIQVARDTVQAILDLF